MPFSLADMGVPMLFITFPAMLVALLPVIVVEVLVLARHLGCSALAVWKPVALANVFSTCIGIPVTWFVLVVLQMVTGGGSAYGLDSVAEKFLAVTWQAPWLIPYDTDLGWMVPTAFLVLLVPFFFVSWWSEWKVAGRFLKHVDAPKLKGGMLISNLASYSLLSLCVGYLFFTGKL